jgi:hypothetical protein
MCEKVRLMAWQEEGISTTATVGRLGRHCTSIYNLLTETRGLPYDTIPQRKKRPYPPDSNKKQALKGLEAIYGGKTALLCRIPSSSGLRSPPDKSSIPAYFLFPKLCFFVHFKESVSCFSHERLIVSLI